jgi:2'-5' RNA ligase
MPTPAYYRYFFAFRPNLVQRCSLEAIATAAGQARRRIKAEYFHLTLFVIAEPSHRDRFIVSRMRAVLDGCALWSCPFWLGRVRGGENGAVMHAMGPQREIQDFYRMLLACLAKRDISPLHRNSGLRPHVTLGYDPCDLKPFEWPMEWIPDELLLIESEVGNGVHNVLARWPLLAPRQGELPFDPPLPPLWVSNERG